MSETGVSVADTNTASKAIARADAKAPIKITSEGMQLDTFEALWRFAVTAVSSGFAPNGLTRPEQVVVAVQYGAELGLRGPMTSLRSIHVINGQPSLAGQAALALCWQRGVFDRVDEIVVAGEGDERHATFTARRKGQPRDFSASYSIADARRDNLLGKDNWKGSPDDMLTWRAVGRWMKRYAPDVLMGLPISEEAADYRVSRDVTPLPAPQPSGPGLLEALDREELAQVEAEVVTAEAEPAPEAPAFDIEREEEDLRAEIESRVGSGEEHEAARVELFRAAVAGMAMASADDFAEAHKRLRQHPMFGDAAINSAHCSGSGTTGDLFGAPLSHDREPLKRGRRG